MSNDQKLTDMIDFFRSRLADEQLRHADALTSAQALQRALEERDARIQQLESELEGYRVPAESEAAEPNTYDPF